MNKRIIFTGGGTAGHVTVNLALIPKFKKDGWDVAYIGSENGIEKQLITDLNEIDYYSISTGKLRRYFDWNNIKDPFRVLKGVFQAYRIIKKRKPDVIFSKGGFVSVPVILGARLNRVPTIIHESDFTPGLANKISIPFATKVCTTFPETAEQLNSEKAVHIGAVVRDELKEGNANRGLSHCAFTKNKPVLLVMGGSLGARRINEAVRDNLEPLLKDFQIVHICGKGNLDESIDKKGYRQFEYVNEELPDLMAMSNFVVSRAGANAIFEFLALKKPMVLIPLSAGASRGDQILNARSFKKSGFCEVLPEEDLTDESFLSVVRHVYENRDAYIEKMEENKSTAAIDNVMEIISAAAD
ncbi:MAG TPA: undecaprenyldiphospho-muramoylpentapeptide beta-N-acetylglucosaminyltransferase [Bacillales bacterium]|nr:undecaprenyldiphospho-muramoylpentapeptide beta-N-acetylglucosaminyltransferase [Bacillales bacterium]